MAEVTDEQMDETLKAIPTRRSDHDRRFDGRATDVRAPKARMSGSMPSEVNQDAVIASLRERIEITS
jgi:hypothetical protein